MNVKRESRVIEFRQIIDYLKRKYIIFIYIPIYTKQSRIKSNLFQLIKKQSSSFWKINI